MDPLITVQCPACDERLTFDTPASSGRIITACKRCGVVTLLAVSICPEHPHRETPPRGNVTATLTPLAYRYFMCGRCAAEVVVRA